VTRTFHIALAVEDVDRVVDDYRQCLGQDPVHHVAGEYALWRTPQINLSISTARPGEDRLRHVGFADTDVPDKTYATDCTGLMWESFAAAHQDAEIAQIYGDR
jgi:catechol 2,3-dioxygenase-like lactoylglutathione lyase family enzyme